MSRSELQGAVDRMRSVDMSYMPVYPCGQVAFDRDCQILARAYITCPPASESVNANLLAACEAVLQMPTACTTDDEVCSNVVRRKYLKHLVAAARAQAKDDAKPVDEEWMDRNIPLTARSHDKSEYRIRFTWTTYKDSRFVVWVNGEILDNTTRGDVRRLLAALGVR